MDSYSIFATEEFDKKFAKLSKDRQKFIENKISEFLVPQLQVEPHFGNNIKKLRGYDNNTYRYRIGNFRIFYQIDEDKKDIALLTIAPRKDAYK